MKVFLYNEKMTLEQVKAKFEQHFSYLKDKRFLNRLWKLWVTDEATFIDLEDGKRIDLLGSDYTLRFDDAGEIVWDYQDRVWQEWIERDRDWDLECTYLHRQAWEDA
jgi:hypothetical protein